MEINPYAPPKSQVLERAPETDSYEYRDISGLTKSVSVLLWVGVVVSMLNVASSLMQLSLLNGPFTQEEGLANDRRELLVSTFTVLLYIATICVFGRWIYVAHRNLPALHAEDLRFRPGFAVGSFFIPVYNLWGPCQAMNDLMRASRNPRQWKFEDTSWVLGAWWTLWIIVNLVGNASFRMTLHADGIDSLRGEPRPLLLVE
jgi:hypothetical protein